MHLLLIGVLSVAILFRWCEPLIAQSISVAPPRPLGLGLSDRPWVEPHLAADPRNPMRLVGTAMVGTTEQASDPKSLPESVRTEPVSRFGRPTGDNHGP